jgi:hypothetical protein
LLGKHPQKVNPKSLTFIAEVVLFGPQNSLLRNLILCLHVASPSAAEFSREEIYQKSIINNVIRCEVREKSIHFYIIAALIYYRNLPEEET